MEQAAASRLKSSFRRHGSNNHVPQLRGREDGPGANGNTFSNGVSETLNEHSRLLSRPFYNEDGQPLYKDSRKWVRWPSETAHIIYKVLASNYVNVLLVFVPVGIIAGALGSNPTAVFVLNFLAIIPLAALLSFATEELSAKVGQTLGGLLNATFGNAVELIVRMLQWMDRLSSLIPGTGQYSGFEEWGDQDRPIQHAGLYSFEHPSCSRLLLPCRWDPVS